MVLWWWTLFLNLSHPNPPTFLFLSLLGLSLTCLQLCLWPKVAETIAGKWSCPSIAFDLGVTLFSCFFLLRASCGAPRTQSSTPLFEWLTRPRRRSHRGTIFIFIDMNNIGKVCTTYLSPGCERRRFRFTLVLAPRPLLPFLLFTIVPPFTSSTALPLKDVCCRENPCCAVFRALR